MSASRFTFADLEAMLVPTSRKEFVTLKEYQKLARFAERMVDAVEQSAGMLPYFSKGVKDTELLEAAKDLKNVLGPVLSAACARIQKAREEGYIKEWKK